jgi:thymidylate synthase (FAD)
MTEQKIDVLDHGFVRLHNHMGNDLEVVRVARQSYDAAWRTGEHAGKDAKLIRYLMTNKHTSPFEAVEFTFEVRAPIFVLRQWMRHRTWSYNEVSARYTELPAMFYTPEAETVGVQSMSNKQSRDVDKPIIARASEVMAYQSRCEAAFREYEWLLAQGWPRELARGVLPLSTYSSMFAKVDLHNLFHFLTLRCDEHAQYEIRVYAEAIVKLIEPIVPVCVAAWRANARPEQKETPKITTQIGQILANSDVPYAKNLHVTASYTLDDMRRDLKNIIGAV